MSTIPFLESPFYDALQSILCKDPPRFLKKKFSASELTDEKYIILQDWCSNNRNLEWETGIGLIEAAENIVLAALENGNIQGEKKMNRRLKQLNTNAENV